MSWAEIKKAINSNISKSLDVLITEKSNEILTKLNSVYNTVTVTGNIPSVKSIQRGISSVNNDIRTYDTISNERYFYIDITINAVNTSKSIVNVSTIEGSYNYGPMLPNSTTIRVYCNITNNTSVDKMYVKPFSWQVIEFY